MTGSGVATGATEVGELRIELRSVNGRGLSLKVRLCAELAGLEAAFEDEIRRALSRGTVTVVVERAGLGAALPELPALQALVADLRQLARDLSLTDELTLRDVLLFATTGRGAVAAPRQLPDGVRALLRAVLGDLVQRRRAEGEVTVQAMRGHLDELATLRQQAAVRAPQVVAEHREKLRRRLDEYLAEQGTALQPADLIREVAMFADRVDVSEELQRLDAHLAELRALLDGGGVVGRKLEFLLQETLRETNTLGSKSPDVALSHCVVAMKSEIDKLKEQAANLE